MVIGIKHTSRLNLSQREINNVDGWSCLLSTTVLKHVCLSYNYPFIVTVDDSLFYCNYVQLIVHIVLLPYLPSAHRS